jgi:hypothetical protein
MSQEKTHMFPSPSFDNKTTLNSMGKQADIKTAQNTPTDVPQTQCLVVFSSTTGRGPDLICYKVFNVAEWNKLSSLISRSEFTVDLGSECSWSLDLTKDELMKCVKVITDHKRIEGFKACFGNNLFSDCNIWDSVYYELLKPVNTNKFVIMFEVYTKVLLDNIDEQVIKSYVKDVIVDKLEAIRLTEGKSVDEVGSEAYLEKWNKFFGSYEIPKNVKLNKLYQIDAYCKLLIQIEQDYNKTSDSKATNSTEPGKNLLFQTIQSAWAKATKQTFNNVVKPEQFECPKHNDLCLKYGFRGEFNKNFFKDQPDIFYDYYHNIGYRFVKGQCVVIGTYDGDSDNFVPSTIKASTLVKIAAATS